ncbi:hypothetical protein [Faecalibacter bovis]|uniref:Uncharacterized protein n=1 Tax=Faecalibacter bovis TaxID=2898187 RepID=A0ABX7XDZ3_9FLAO|nr:hypothetical protein [Faecalibacter bovis]QTV06075.1 hypothetical protein J9309_01620 [Faecalibacter bovis]
MKYLFLLIPIIAFSNPKTIDYQEQINQLKVENVKLEAKLEALNDANDKILNTIYWTIGTVFTVYFGFNLVNFIKSNRDNSKALKDLETKSLKKVTELANSNLQSFNGRISSSIGQLKDDLKISLTDYHPDSAVLKDPQNIILYIVATKVGSAGKALSTLDNYLNDLKNKNETLKDEYKYELIDILKTFYTEEYLRDRVEDLIIKLKEL